MKKYFVVAGALAALTVPAFATDDVITTRQVLMQSNAASAGLAGGMLKQEIPYSPVAANAVLASLAATALAYGDYFPEGSDVGDTRASPKIWEDAAGFEAEIQKFQKSSMEAKAAAGREGPADLATFQASVIPVLDSCKTCHESYQLPRE